MDTNQPQDEGSSGTGDPQRTGVVSRRLFARAGLSGSVVLGSLTSRPVLGAVPYHCTVSGQVSGNLSRPGLPSACVIGRSPSDWAASTWSVTSPPGFTKGTLPSNSCSFTGGGRSRGTNFNGYVAGPGIPALINSFYNYDPPGGGNNCGVVTSPTTTNPATFLQLVASTSMNEQFVLGRVVATSLLNAATYGSNYPVTAHSIVAMFNATFGGGSYQVTTGVFWNRARVIQYLSSLYPA